MKTEKQTTQFCKEYLATALWSSVQDDGCPFDADYSIDDFAPEAVEKAERDCATFLEGCHALIIGHQLSQVAHDLWLTCNHHGSGFWDGDYSERDGEILTDYCQNMGEVDVVLGDDGKLYLE